MTAKALIALMREYQENRAKLAQNFYAAYLAKTGGKDWRGDPCPQWKDLTDGVRAAWIAVVEYAASGAVYDIDMFMANASK